MKQTLVIALLTVTLGLPALTQTASKTAHNGKAEQEVLKLMSQLEEAHRKGDVTFFDRLYADDYIATTLSGTINEGKPKAMEDWKSRNLQYVYYKYYDLRVRVYGNSAVVTNRVMRKGTYRGRDINDQARQTQVLVKQQGRWQLVASQATRISQE